MSGSGCCHPPRMTEYYRYPQQKRAPDSSSPAEEEVRRPPGGMAAIAGPRAAVGTGPAGGAGPQVPQNSRVDVGDNGGKIRGDPMGWPCRIHPAVPHCAGDHECVRTLGVEEELLV